MDVFQNFHTDMWLGKDLLSCYHFQQIQPFLLILIWFFFCRFENSWNYFVKVFSSETSLLFNHKEVVSPKGFLQIKKNQVFYSVKSVQIRSALFHNSFFSAIGIGFSWLESFPFLFMLVSSSNGIVFKLVWFLRSNFF